MVKNYFVSEDAEVQKYLKKAADDATSIRPLSVIAVQATHPLHMSHIGQVVKRLLLETNHRKGEDIVIKQGEKERYFVALGYEEQMAKSFAVLLDEGFTSMNLRYAGPVTTSKIDERTLGTLTTKLYESKENTERLRRQEAILKIKEHGYKVGAMPSFA